MGSKAGELVASIAALFVIWAMVRGALKNILDAIKVLCFLASLVFAVFGVYTLTQPAHRLAGPVFLGVAAACYVVHWLLSPAGKD